MLTRQNVNDVQAFLTQKLTYPSDWRDAVLNRKKEKMVAWGKTGLASVTWRNTRTSICGFVEFGKYLFETIPGVEYFGILACTSSSLETIFSCIRSLGGNTLSM